VPEPVAIGVDVGGTKLAAGAVSAEGTVVRRTRRQTPAGDADALLSTIVAVVEELLAGGPALPVGVAIAGLVDRQGRVRYGPNIGVRDLPLADLAARALAVPIALVNDASAAVLGEQRVGGAVGHEDVVMFTLGTGVGGGVMVAGRLVEGHDGLAGELGHVIVEDGGRRCPCGTLGCLEAYASGRAIEALAHERFTGERVAMLPPATPLTGRAVVDAARSGVAEAEAVLGDVGRWLGVAIASMVAALDPSIVLVGGGAGVATAPWVLPAARESAQERLFGRGWRAMVPVEAAALGDDAGLIGAALLAAGPDGTGVRR
jgi:glucokinase